MIDVKITKTVAKAYRQACLGDEFPTEEGIFRTDEGNAIRLRESAYQRWEAARNPAEKAAFEGLFRQLDKGLMPAEKDDADVSHAKLVEQFIVVQRSELLISDQVRSDFDDVSVAELAEDIKEHGLINPVTVRPAHGGSALYKYFLVAGERRVRACELAGHPILAQVLDVDHAGAKRIQLAENIHREDLSIADKAKAIREIYDELGKMQAVADLVKKSKAWVSKLVAVTEPGFGLWATRLLEEGFCEDLELLGVISQIESSCGWREAEDAAQKVQEGKLNRKEARELMRSLKEEREKNKQPEEQTKKKKESVDEQLKNAKDEQKNAREEMERAKRKRQQEEALRLDPLEVLQKLVRYYVITEERTFDGDSVQVATEFDTLPLAGTRSCGNFQAFTDLEIKLAWRTAVESLTEHLCEPVTLKYFELHK